MQVHLIEIPSLTHWTEPRASNGVAMLSKQLQNLDFRCHTHVIFKHIDEKAYHLEVCSHEYDTLFKIIY